MSSGSLIRVSLLALTAAACAETLTRAETQLRHALDLCARFVRRQLDDSIQYHGDQLGFLVTDDFRVQRWTDSTNPAAWIEVEADGGSMHCEVRASRPLMPSTSALIDTVSGHLYPQTSSNEEHQTGPVITSWALGQDGGLVTLASTPEGHSIAFSVQRERRWMREATGAMQRTGRRLDIGRSAWGASPGSLNTPTMIWLRRPTVRRG